MREINISMFILNLFAYFTISHNFSFVLLSHWKPNFQRDYEESISRERKKERERGRGLPFERTWRRRREISYFSHSWPRRIVSFFNLLRGFLFSFCSCHVLSFFSRAVFSVTSKTISLPKLDHVSAVVHVSNVSIARLERDLPHYIYLKYNISIFFVKLSIEKEKQIGFCKTRRALSFC